MKYQKIIFFFLIIVIFSFSGLTAAESYVYNFWGEAVPGPPVYQVVAQYTGEKLGTERLRDPESLFVDHNDNVYIVDSGNNRILHLDADYNLVRVIDGFQGKEDEQKSFNNPVDIFVDLQGFIYIADRNNRRIVITDQNLNLVRIITEPEDSVAIPEGFIFSPEKLAVSPLDNRIYVIAAGVLEGFMVFDFEGFFEGFMGAPRVTPSAADFFWRSIMTERQRERARRFLPTQYSNIDISDSGFIYATVSHGQIRQEEAIRKLTSTGREVLSRTGFFPPIGDVKYPAANGITGPSLLYDITVHENGNYSAIDSRRGRIFTYNRYGDLLFVFGGPGDQKGKFRTPVAIEKKGDSLLVLDRRKNSITEFSPTDYTRMIYAAIDYYEIGEYDNSTDKWRQVVSRNPNLDLAYRGIGRAYLRDDSYQLAMDNFRLANYRQGYSQAWSILRRLTIIDNFEKLIIGFVLSILIIILMIKYLFSFEQNINIQLSNKEEKNNLFQVVIAYAESLRYSLYVIFHPFAGFWDLKHEKRGNAVSASIILILVTFSYLLLQAYGGFLFNYTDIARLNVFVELLGIVTPVLLWSGVNWGLTTLMEGKGTLKDIYIATCYALTPIFIFYIPLVAISRYLTLDESSFYHMFLSLPVIWSMALVFSGTMITHSYTVSKNLLTTIFTIVGIGIVIFVALLFFNVLAHLGGFIETIYFEINMRI